MSKEISTKLPAIVAEPGYIDTKSFLRIRTPNPLPVRTLSSMNLIKSVLQYKRMFYQGRK